jgi:integrase
VYVGRDPDKAVRDPDTGRVIKQGPPIHVSKVFTGGIREAKKELAKFEVTAAQRRAVGTSTTVGKLLTEYLSNGDRCGWAPSTLETYESHARNHIRPALGSIRLNKLETRDIDRFLTSLDRDKGLSAGTIVLIYSVLSGALTQAVDWEWLPTNVAKKARLAKPQTAQKAHLTIGQLKALYGGALADEDIDMATMIALAAYTGCRRGELAGMRWADLDIERQTLTVRRSLGPGVGGQRQGLPKNGEERVVHLGTAGVDLLLLYKSAKAAQIGVEPDGWLLSYDGGVTPLRAKSMTEYFGRLAARLGIKASLHSFRHWNATELNRAGVDLPTAAAQLGHSAAVMAQNYLHTDDGRGAIAGTTIAAVLGPVFSDSPG